MQDSPNILQIFNNRAPLLKTFHADIFLEYCNYNLRQIISNPDVVFTIDTVQSIMRQVLFGLDFIHSKSVCLKNIENRRIHVKNIENILF